MSLNEDYIGPEFNVIEPDSSQIDPKSIDWPNNKKNQNNSIGSAMIENK